MMSFCKQESDPAGSFLCGLAGLQGKSICTVSIAAANRSGLGKHRAALQGGRERGVFCLTVQGLPASSITSFLILKRWIQGWAPLFSLSSFTFLYLLLLLLPLLFLFVWTHLSIADMPVPVTCYSGARIVKGVHNYRVLYFNFCE